MAQNEQKVSRKRPPTVQIGLRMPADVAAQLEVLASRELASVQQVMRRAIAEYLERTAAA